MGLKAPPVPGRYETHALAFDAWWSDESAKSEAQVGEWGVEDSEGVWWPSRWAQFWSGELQLCGCGSDEPKIVGSKVLYALWCERGHNRPSKDAPITKDYRHASATFGGEEFWYTPIVELFLHVLDSRKVTEHGVSVGACWLSDDWMDRVTAIFGPFFAPKTAGEG